jgi:hypothetical protein
MMVDDFIPPLFAVIITPEKKSSETKGIYFDSSLSITD